MSVKSKSVLLSPVAIDMQSHNYKYQPTLNKQLIVTAYMSVSGQRQLPQFAFCTGIKRLDVCWAGWDIR